MKTEILDNKSAKKYTHTDSAIVLSLIFLMLVGLILMNSSSERYKSFVAEDGPVEWIATISLFSCAVVSIERALKFKNKKSKSFYFVSLLIALVFLLGVGEEVSWGQRIFNIESSDFFKENNLQEEINFHNLKLGFVNINKLLFGLIMGAFIALYLIILPVIYMKQNKIKLFIDNLGVPIPRYYHIVGILSSSMFINFLHAKDKWELMELTGSMLFLAIMIYPANNNSLE
jgi:cell division protein FtsW (lipid II flippase)